MIEFGGICVPITMDCNLHCKYCFRDNRRIDKVPEFTPDMIECLKNLFPEKCKIATATGGEPFLRFDKVKEYFSYVHKDIHKKIISNCTLLTQEIVDYINDNNIELQVSHDGSITKFLRGVDIFEDEKKLDLVRQIKNLKVSSVTTKYNVDIWENFFYIVKKLKRIDIDYGAGLLYDNPFNRDLIEGFDYKTWFITWIQFQCSPYKIKHKVLPEKRPLCFDVLPNGIVCGNLDICANYGSIHSESMDVLVKNLTESGAFDYCVRTGCKYIKNCRFPCQGASDHICRCRKMIMDFSIPKNIRMIHLYLDKHLSEIEEKYGYVKEQY